MSPALADVAIDVDRLSTFELNAIVGRLEQLEKAGGEAVRQDADGGGEETQGSAPTFGTSTQGDTVRQPMAVARWAPTPAIRQRSADR